MYNYKLYKIEYGHHGICIRRIDTTETGYLKGIEIMFLKVTKTQKLL